MSTLVHICCSVDSHYYLQAIAQQEDKNTLTGFFYNPNIHPRQEYDLRLLDVQRSCKQLGVPLLEGPYDYPNWYKATKTLQAEPEKGRRCDVCFESRFEQTARKAKELGIDKMTTTLLMSPKKSYAQLVHAGRKAARKYGIAFVDYDCTSACENGEQNRAAKEAKLYRQDYCGCSYALQQQRRAQGQIPKELFSSLDFKNEPASFSRRQKLYQKRLSLEEKKIAYTLCQNKTLSYHLLSAYVKEQGTLRPAFFLPYSTTQSPHVKTKVQEVFKGVGYCNKEQIKICPLWLYNKKAGTDFQSVAKLLRARPDFDTQVAIRREFVGDFDLSAIVIMDTVPAKKLHLHLDARTQIQKTTELVSDALA